eukprot:IDg655t1
MSSEYFDAWFAACRKACRISHNGARRTAQDILEQRPQATLAHIWSNGNSVEGNDKISMSIGAFALVVTKISADIKRKMLGPSARHEFNVSQQKAWAEEMMRIDRILSAQE